MLHNDPPRSESPAQHPGSQATTRPDPAQPASTRPMRAAAYIRVSTDQQGDQGASLDHQKTATLHEIHERHWELAEIASDVASAKTMKRRPGLEAVLSKLDRGELDALVVSRLDRLSRNLVDFGMLIDRADRNDWALIVLDPRVDLTTPYGKAMAGMGAVFAQLERDLIAQRTREGIQARKAAGTYRGGRNPQHAWVKPVDDTTMQRILELRANGHSHRQIAHRFTSEGIPTTRGGPWHRSTIATAIRRHAQREAPQR